MFTPRILHSPPEILNQNYAPLLKKHPTLRFYFQLCLKLIDDNIPPNDIFTALLDMYLTFPYLSSGTGRIIEQQKLILAIKKELHEKGIRAAFEWLDRSDDTIHTQDDLIYLLSAYCSVFPYMNPIVTNPHIKNALIIRDINNIYLHTLLKQFIENCKTRQLIMATEAIVHAADLTGQYEWLLTTILKETKPQYLFSAKGMSVLLKPATEKQVEEKVLPFIFSHFNSNQDSDSESHPEAEPLLDTQRKRKINNAPWLDSILQNALPAILEKVSKQTIEDIIVPKLLELFQITPFLVSETLLLCMNYLNEDALKSCCQKFLTSYCLPENEEKTDNNTLLLKSFALKPFLAMISRFKNHAEIDEITEKLLTKFSIYQAADILTFLKKLRSQNLYVSETLFKTVSDSVKAQNDTALDNQNDLYLCPEHMNREQIQRYFDSTDLEKEKKSAVTSKLIAFSSLPETVFSEELRHKSFEFLSAHRHDSGNHAEALACYLQKFDFSMPDARRKLIELCDYAMTEIMEVCRSAPLNEKDEDYFLKLVTYNRAMDNTYYHRQLLKTCASLMTGNEIKEHILEKIEIRKIAKDRYLKPLSETLQQIFANNDQSVLNQFFPDILHGLKKNIYNSDYENLLSILVNQVSPDKLIYVCRHLMKPNLSAAGILDSEVYALGLIYEKNKSWYSHIPGFCTGDSYGWHLPIKGEAEPAKSHSFCAHIM